jgi:hydroxymethylpyrimidine/phosphomethylpyrimidine kinase
LNEGTTPPMPMRKSKLTIVAAVGGHDPGSGAGIVADALRIAAEGALPVTVVTAVTAQSTGGVSRVAPVPPREFRAILRELFGDLRPEIVKTGLLPSAQHVRVLHEETPPRIPMVIDPVFASSGGHPFLDARGVAALVTLLFPRAVLVTPNLDEADALSGLCAHSPRGAVEAARRMLQWGPRAVLLKGGHGAGPTVIDRLVQRGLVREFRGSRIGDGAHGTGCALASVVAARLALGDPLDRAVAAARRRVRAGLRRAIFPGKGRAILGL